MHWQDYIGYDSSICHGQVCFKIGGKLTRIMVYLVLEMLGAGETAEEIISKTYPQLTPDHIKATFHYAAEIIKIGEFTPFVEIA